MNILSRSLNILILSSFFNFTACSNPKENKSIHEKITVFQGTLDATTGNVDELTLIKNFPKALYKIVTIPDSGSFYVDSLSDIIKNELRLGHVWEGNIVKLMKNHVKPGSTAIDIGAHIGTHTIAMSKFVGNEGQVIAFEPQLKLYSELVMNALLNNCQNITAYRCAVGDSFTSIEMNPSYAGNEGGTAIGKGGDTAEMITLDSLNLNNVSFIKIDVENFEYEVLAGAEQTIRKNHPFMIIEIMGNIYNPIPNRAELVHKTLKKIESLGYSLNYIEGSWSDWLATPLETVDSKS